MKRLPNGFWGWRRMPRSRKDIDRRVRELVEERRLLVKVIRCE